MNIQFKISAFLFAVLFLIPGYFTEVLASERKVNLNKGWKFHLGNIEKAEQPSFNDQEWRVLDLPHDWSIEPVMTQKEGVTIGPFSRESEGGPDTGQTLGGEGWYRKTFTLSKEDTEKLISLYIEGAYGQSEIWINGKKIHYNPYGYTSYKVDLTEHCNPVGVPNQLAIRVVNEGKNSRWYAGSGIYRPVWLIKTDRIHLDEWDTFIHTAKVQQGEATLQLSTILYSIGSKSKKGELDIKILSPSGKEVLRKSQKIKFPSTTEKNISLSFPIKNPELWSIDTPALYKAEVSVISNGKTLDHITIPFGIRTIAFSADKGFLLNGEPLKLKGGCVHHDNGLLGAVAIQRAEERKVELLKANGFNAVRCAHNLPSEYFLEACDKLGMLVINEVFDQWQKPKRPQDYHLFFNEWSERDMATMVKRDRNHPSIIMWSIGNEIQERADSIGEEIAKRLVKTIHTYDTTRFTTIAANEFWDNRHLKWDASERAFRNVDIAGYNYMWKEYENDHAKHPQRVMYGTESVPKETADNWNLIEKHPFLIGDFVWTAIDYLGEAGLAHSLELAPGERNPQFMGWPWYNAWCGDIDFCGDKKPQSYFRDVIWREREIALAAQPPVAEGKREDINYWGWRNEFLSWNWKGLEGQTMKVNVYSRAPKVKLYLNEKLLGEKEVDPRTHTASFDVTYEPGELKAVNITNGNESASASLKTTGKPATIRLTADRAKIKASKNDLSYVKIEIIDEDGNIIPDTNLPVTIQCTGNGSVIAAGNASPDDMKSFRSLTPNTFRGKAMAIIQPNETPGDIQLTVSAEGLNDSSLTIQTH